MKIQENKPSPRVLLHAKALRRFNLSASGHCRLRVHSAGQARALTLPPKERYVYREKPESMFNYSAWDEAKSFHLIYT